MRTHLRSVVASWRNQSPAIRLMRFWLGVTWIYGGWDKATDPGFLGKTSISIINRASSKLDSQDDVSALVRAIFDISLENENLATAAALNYIKDEARLLL